MRNMTRSNSTKPSAAEDLLSTPAEALVADGTNIIITTGFALATATTIAAKANPDVWFIGVDQDICVDAEGNPDDEPPCDGDAATLLPNLVAMKYREDQDRVQQHGIADLIRQAYARGGAPA